MPYLPLAPSLWLTVPSLATLGAGSAAVVVATYTSLLEATLSIPGYSESDATYSLGEVITKLSLFSIFIHNKVILPSVRTAPCVLFSGLLHWSNNCWGHLSEGMWDQEQWNIMMIQITDITISHRWDSEWAVFWFNNWQCSCSLWTSFRCGEGAPTPVKQNIQT